ncbi:MAG: hypothetical protein NT166_05965 [Candidatus Aminicenantes bacterium]|nr:hypothetical protein [Candidatus Aminicenantes bacterium]
MRRVKSAPRCNCPFWPAPSFAADSKDNALFTGFVKFRNNEYVEFSVIVSRSGLGARIAGKLTAQIMGGIIEYENKKGNPLQIEVLILFCPAITPFKGLKISQGFHLV